MKLVNNAPYSDHQDVFLLLPWYVNETLHGPELKRVEAHLNVCLTCKRELASLHKLALMVNQSGTHDSAEQVSFTQLQKRLHQTHQSSPKPSSQLVASEARTKRPLTHRSFPHPSLALAAVLVLSMLVFGVMRIETVINNDYRTLSDSEPAATNRNEIHIVFADNTTQQQINSLLAPFSGKIAAQPQPTEQAVYSVRFEQTHTKEEMLNILAQLRKNPQVIFAEPAYALLSSPSTERSQK